ncbi:MAG: ATP-binding cassette domain-containing protein [Pseudonocardiaceae bacterium]|nr:ATP-binding cassette domain-containing protein [Pseudonocardiaceae bacterium]
MQDGSGRIVVQNLSKNFGQVAAVQNLSFHVEPGSVTGFLGPNGSGKTTTLRMLLGLVTPTAGFTTINGQPFNRLGNPGRVVGGVLEAQGFHPSRTARDHLRVYAAAMGVPDQRADEVVHLVGLGAAARRAAGGFSLGMKQRLALATALLGDPQVLVLDEPANGLDPEGIAWLRTFLKAFAQSGRTVLISSHLLAEVEQTIDQVVIISHGQTMYYGMLDDLRKSQQSRVIVQPADPQKLAVALQEMNFPNVAPTPDGKLAVVGATVQQIGDIAAQAGVALYGVHEERADLEQLFFRLTSGQYAAPGQVPHGQLPPIPPGYQAPQGYAPQGYAPAPQPYQQPGGYQQAPGTPPGGYQAPPQGWDQQQAPGAPQAPQQGWDQQAPGTPPGGNHQPPPPGWDQPAPGTPPGGYRQQAPQTPPDGWGQQPGGPQPVPYQQPQHANPPQPPPPAPPADRGPGSSDGGAN